MVSLIFESTNLLVKGSIEASSPEEMHENDLPLSGSIPLAPSRSHSLVDFNDMSFASATPIVSPLLTEGVFPYQPNPIGAIVAAGLTMAVMALKESGGIDLQGISYILNSSDFYVGLAGSAVSSVTHKQTIKMIESALARGAGSSPDVLKPVLTSATTRQLGNIINGFTYTFAVSSGFEYFSQVWKHATRNIPEAHTVGGFLRAEPLRKKQVALNLMYYLVVDTNMQKRILSSVYNHRILTFEFIATNVALYVGAQLGSVLSAKYGANTPWLKKLGPVLGSISGGLIVQSLPESWTSAANTKLAQMKITSHQKRLEANLKQIEVGVQSRFYPVQDHPAVGYWVRGASLESDVDRVLRERDLIASLELQLILGNPNNQVELSRLSGVFNLIESRLKTVLVDIQGGNKSSLDLNIEKWVKEGRSAEEIQRLGAHYPDYLTQTQYYSLVLDAALDRCRTAGESANALVKVIGQRKLDPSEIAVFGAQ